VRARELYRRFRQEIDDLANRSEAGAAWLSQVRDLTRQFETETGALEPKSAAQLRDELCEQLEHDAFHALCAHRREVLLAAVKQLELSSPV
jgi:hypothetical protein